MFCGYNNPNVNESNYSDNVIIKEIITDVGYCVAASFYDFPFKSGYSIVDENIDIIFESAENAMSDPYKITQSIYYT